MDGMATGMAVQPMAGAMGAEIQGVDLGTMDEAMFAAVHKAFLEHQVLVFRDQDLTADAFAAVARQFGEPVPYPFTQGDSVHPEITVIVKEADQTSNFGGMWHSDTTYKPEPPMGTVLMSRETPAAGGDTLFACQYSAYEALSDGMRAMLDGQRGVSSSAKNAGQLRINHAATNSMQLTNADKVLQAVHPAVRVHPETGRKALFVNRAHTIAFEGMTEAESAPILEFLFNHQIAPEFTARVRWAPNTVVIWDNRSSQHCAINDYDGHRRQMWRITLAGDAPLGSR
ncbi:MAG: TauD/TfdA dioxygenase family protein [Paracoccaceae bacterium]